MAYIVDALRALVAGELTDTAVLHGVVAASAIATVGLGLGLGTRAMRRGI